jgi:hypothetical protein
MQFKELSGIIIPMTLPRSLFIFLFGQGRALPTELLPQYYAI